MIARIAERILLEVHRRFPKLVRLLSPFCAHFARQVAIPGEV